MSERARGGHGQWQDDGQGGRRKPLEVRDPARVPGGAEQGGGLGTHRLNLGNGYALHGTNQPASVGRAVSHGCVRLRNEDIAKLYAMVPVGTPVYIY